MDGRNEVSIRRRDGNEARLTLAQGDITRFEADAIVNAANEGLRGGGGVDGAIHRAAGPDLMAELRSRYDHCPTGSAVITGAGRLAEHGVRSIIHAVGPVWYGGRRDEEAKLRSAYLTSLRLADEAGARTVALPAISCGVYGYPLPDGASVALAAVRHGLRDAKSLDTATFVLYGRETYAAFAEALRAFPSEPDR